MRDFGLILSGVVLAICVLVFLEGTIHEMILLDRPGYDFEDVCALLKFLGGLLGTVLAAISLALYAKA